MCILMSLDESLSLFVDSVTDCIKNEKSIMILTHMDCDGLASGSIMAKALIRAGAACTLRTSTEFNASVAEALGKDGRDFHIVTDLGAGSADVLDLHLSDRWLVLDHHHISDAEMDNERVINAWKYGMDGGVDISAGGMAYLASISLNQMNTDLSPIAVVSALGDRQDQGEKRSLVGKNREIADTAKSLELISIDLDLLLYGRETRPLVDALAYTSQPYIKGITWERGNCAAMLKQAGIKLKDKGRWRVPAELSQKEKAMMIDAIAKYAPGQGVTNAVVAMMGYAYVITGEEEGSFLRDCREFGTMLNSCGRIGKAGTGMAICMGDRGRTLVDAEEILKQYRSRIREYMSIISNDRWRTAIRGLMVMVNADGVVPEAMTGTMASLISGSPRYTGKIIILYTGGSMNTVKFSARKSRECDALVNLNSLMNRGTKKFGGVGGGHGMAAGARIGKDKLDEFLDYLEADVNNMHNPD